MVKKAKLHTGVGYPAGVKRSTRRIEGHTYYFKEAFEKKSDATYYAKRLREGRSKGYKLSVRVVQTHGLWAIFYYNIEGAAIEKKYAPLRKKRAPRKGKK